MLGPRDHFLLTKPELAALLEFSSKDPCTSMHIWFVPSFDEGAAVSARDSPDDPPTSKKVSHIVASDGHTMICRVGPVVECEEFGVSREVLGMLYGAVRGYSMLILRPVEDKRVSFFIGGDRRYVEGFFDEARALMQGSFAAQEPRDSMRTGYTQFVLPVKPSHQKFLDGYSGMDTTYLARLAKVAKAAGRRNNGIKAYIRKDLDPATFDAEMEGPEGGVWRAVIMPMRL